MNTTVQKVTKDILWHYHRNLALLRRENGRFIRKQEARMRNRIDIVLKKQMNWVLNRLQDFGPLKQNAIGYNINALDDQVDGMLNDMPGASDMVETILIYSATLMEKGGNSITRKAEIRKFGISFDVKHPDAVKFLKDKKILELSNSRGNIDSRTKARIKSLIVTAISNGENYGQLAQKIMAQGNAGVFSYARAEMIAVREAGVAYEYGKTVPIKEFLAKDPSRQVKKYWNTSGDSEVTPECEENERVSPIAFNETFPNDGAEQSAPRSGNPRCRCWTTYEII